MNANEASSGEPRINKSVNQGGRAYSVGLGRDGNLLKVFYLKSFRLAVVQRLSSARLSVAWSAINKPMTKLLTVFAAFLLLCHCSCDHEKRLANKYEAAKTTQELQEVTDAINQRCIFPIFRAFREFSDANRNHFPAQFSTDQAGNPLLSWRVHLLPYLGEQALYERFALNEPWNSETNLKLLAEMPEIYKHPHANGTGGQTVIQVVEGENVVIVPPEPSSSNFESPRGIRYGAVTDGMTNTGFLVTVEDRHAVNWTEPTDFDYRLYSDPASELKTITGKSAIYGDSMGGYYDTNWMNGNFDKIVVRNDGQLIEWHNGE